MTQGPETPWVALLVGVAAAKSAAWALKTMIIVNHMEGHIFANLLQYPDLEPPFLALVVSGGHTMIVIVKDCNTFQLLGQTRDDAAGEAFDKIARVMGYPIREVLTSTVWRRKEIRMPSISRWDLEKSTYDFSFSGLKSAVINYLNTAKMKKRRSIRRMWQPPSESRRRCTGRESHARRRCDRSFDHCSCRRLSLPTAVFARP